MKQQQSEIKTIPFKGGMNTVVEPSAIPAGGFSMIQNLRPRHPGFIKRKGQTQQHSTADGTNPANKVLSLYQFSKAKRVENHLFAQMSDSDVLEASNNPPAITTGAFGSEIFSGASSPVDASWATINDLMLFANGVDYQQIYSGNLSRIGKFVVYRGAGAIPIIPILGEDYSNEVSDGLSTTVAPLDSLGVIASPDYDCFFVMTPVQAKALNITITAANGTSAVAQMEYWKGSWAAVSGFTDNTATGGKTLGIVGTNTMTWTPAADELPHAMFGAPGYWYRVSLASGALDSDVKISEVTYEANWQTIKNIWDGVLLDIIEFQFYKAAGSTYETFGAASIQLNSATASDAFYFSTPDLIEAFYVDVGALPNTTGSTTINKVYRWDGAAWQEISGIVDGTAGLSKSGWVWIGRNVNFQQTFQTTEYYAYWYKFTVDKTLNDNVIVGLSYRPYFDITELGKGQTVEVWKGRACYSFDQWGQYLYVAAVDAPQVLNGNDYGILEAGDGRANKIVAMRKFYNELMVWQAEIGKEGGCLTLFEGYSPTTFGKLLLSSKLGAMNNKSVEVIDGVLTSTATDETIKTLAFCLSRYGVYVSDGRTCSFIDDQVRNYFDPIRSECIRRGYESEMWLKYDSAYNVIRVGLVSGSSATVPNVFLVFDLKEKVWSLDSLGQPLSCMTEVSATSGNVPVLQVGGGCADGFIYLLNFGDNDMAAAIDSFATMELTGRGEIIQLREMILRMKSQTAGNCTLIPSLNGIAQTALTLTMTPEITNQIIRRHRIPLNLVDQHISLKFQNATASESIYLEDFGLRLFSYGEQ